MFKQNDLVRIKNSNLYGKIIRISKNNTSTLYTVLLDNNSKISTLEDNLELSISKVNPYLRNSNKSHVSITYNTSTNNFKNEIMIRHQNVLEAIENVDYFISSALINKEKKLRIIHGRHGGILRNAVHEYLNNSPFVESYHLADEYEGSIGVTIVYLK